MYTCNLGTAKIKNISKIAPVYYTLICLFMFVNLQSIRLYNIQTDTKNTYLLAL